MVGQFFTMLFSKIAAVIEWFGDLAVEVFKSLWHMVTDVVCWSFEGFLKIAVSAVEKIDVSGITTSLGAWGALPAEVLNILGLLGVGQAVAIIGSAIGIRMALQLIPFVRLGS